MSYTLLSELCFEQVKDNFWLASYDGIVMIMKKDSGWVNATKLCRQGGKRFKKWLENKSSIDLMTLLSSMLNKTEFENEKAMARIRADVSKCIQTSSATVEDCVISGTYIHPDLVNKMNCKILRPEIRP